MPEIRVFPNTIRIIIVRGILTLDLLIFQVAGNFIYSFERGDKFWHQGGIFWYQGSFYLKIF